MNSQTVSITLQNSRCQVSNCICPQAMLQQVFIKGPFTQGIFRKSANARLVRELREQLDSGQELALEHIPVLAVAALLKEFLRSLPDPLLGAALYPLYMEALECREEQEKLIRVKRCALPGKFLWLDSPAI